MQYQFELSKNLKFRQLNLAYQEGVGGNFWAYHGDVKPGIVIPLYSTVARESGLFNSLDDPDSKNEGGEKKRASVR